MFSFQTSITVDIPAQHHRALLANRGQKVHEIQSEYNVQIRFPDRRGPAVEGAEAEAPTADADRVTISGRDTKCEAAKEALLALVPISKQVSRGVIGHSGECKLEL